MMKYITNRVIPKDKIIQISALEGIKRYNKINITKVNKKEESAPVRIVKSNTVRLAKPPRAQHRIAVLAMPIRIWKKKQKHFYHKRKLSLDSRKLFSF